MQTLFLIQMLIIRKEIHQYLMKESLERKQLFFLIEDTDGKKFGYYLNTEVDDKYDIIIGTDNKSFKFNLQSNKLFLQRMKYEIKRINYGYILFDKSIPCFFTLGDIYLFKEFNKNNHVVLKIKTILIIMELRMYYVEKTHIQMVKISHQKE